MSNSNEIVLTFDSLVYVDDMNITASELCEKVIINYTAPSTNEKLELDSTSFNIINNKNGTILYSRGDKGNIDLNGMDVLIQVVNQFKPVELNITSYDEILEWFEEAIISDSDVPASIGKIKDESLHFFKNNKEIV